MSETGRVKMANVVRIDTLGEFRSANKLLESSRRVGKVVVNL